MFDGILKTRREICMSTMGGCHILINPENGDEIKIKTGCKNMPAKGSKFCSDCLVMCVRHQENINKSKKVGDQDLDEMS